MHIQFWAPRASFLAPIPEMAAAADLLSLAADSLLASDTTQARSYLEQADMPAQRVYTRSIASQVSRDIHRFREVPGLPAAIPEAQRGRRQPKATTALEIYRRDGFHCRYCGCRVVDPRAESIISALVPGAVRWGKKDVELNAAFYTLKGVLDHVEPHAHGGGSSTDNLVVACQPCNYGKGNWFIQQLGLSDPRFRPPQATDWDGLQRIVKHRPSKAARRGNIEHMPDVSKRPNPALSRPIAPNPPVPSGRSLRPSMPPIGPTSTPCSASSSR